MKQFDQMILGLHHDDRTAILGQIERMNRRIDEAVERWLSERRALQSEIEEWRGKLAEMSGKLLAAEKSRLTRRFVSK